MWKVEKLLWKSHPCYPTHKYVQIHPWGRGLSCWPLCTLCWTESLTHSRYAWEFRNWVQTAKRRNERKNCSTMTISLHCGKFILKKARFSASFNHCISLPRLARIVKLLALFIYLTFFPTGIRIPEKWGLYPFTSLDTEHSALHIVGTKLNALKSTFSSNKACRSNSVTHTDQIPSFLPSPPIRRKIHR